MKRYGIEWTEDGEYWSGRRGRYRPVTWKFGEIHQCVVDIDSPSAHPWRGHIHICLPPQKTRLAAMKRAVEWIDYYEKRGPLGAEKAIKRSLLDWPTLYKERADVLDQMFFVGGAGYDWLDGALIEANQLTAAEAAAERRARRREDEKAEKMHQDVERVLAEAKRLLGDNMLSLSQEPVAPRRRAFYPVSEHSCVARVPDDVRPDWLKVAYEAAIALRDSTVASERPEGAAALICNRDHGRKIVADLERRFVGRVP